MTEVTLSPINQKIAKTEKINKNNANTLASVKDNSVKKDEFINSRKKVIAGGIIGCAALIGGLGILAYKGKFGTKVQDFVKNIVSQFKGSVKTKPIKETNPPKLELKKGVKKFFDKENKLVEGVKLEKGKAVIEAGEEPFTGVMRTIDGKGREITLEYKNGILKSSAIDGKLKKTYSSYREMIDSHFSKTEKELMPETMNMITIEDVQKGTSATITKEGGRVTTYMHFGNKEDAFANFKKIEFGSNGQITRSLKNNYENVDFVEFSHGGHKIQQIETIGEKVYKQSKFDADGTILEEVVGDYVLMDFYSPSGIRVINSNEYFQGPIYDAEFIF